MKKQSSAIAPSPLDLIDRCLTPHPHTAAPHVTQHVPSLPPLPQSGQSGFNLPQHGQFRLPYIDNLRWVLIMLVVSMHAAVTYSHIGSWYYMEDTPLTPIETGIFATYEAFLQSFFMGFLFFIAGYFVPGAYDKKGAAIFLKDRAIRLGLPLILFVFILQPLSIYCISLFHGPDVGGSFLHIYRHYIQSGRWKGGTGPLWFCETLLIFCIGYTGCKAIPALRTGHHPSLPTRIALWSAIALITLATFFVRISWPNGTAFYNLQFCYFPQYILFFIAGTFAWRGNWLQNLPASTSKYWGRVGFIGGSLLWIALLLFGGAFNGQVSLYRGGYHWQSLGLCCWESMTGIALSLFLLIRFREHANQQGKLASFFSSCSFSVYVLHTPVLITLSRMMSNWHEPLLFKFVVLTLCSILATYLLASQVFRRIPLLKTIL